MITPVKRMLMVLCGGLAFSSAGHAAEQWSQRYSGGTSSRDLGFFVRVDASGESYVAGNLGGGNGDIAVLKYSVGGTLLWAYRYDGPLSGHDFCTALALDSSAVYVAGASEGLDGSLDIVTLRLSPAGALDWERRYADPGTDRDQAVALALDPSGNVVVAGSTYEQSERFDVAIIKYSAGGALLWQERYADSIGTDEVALALDLGSDGSVVVAGYQCDADSTADGLLLKYSATGVPAWARTFKGGGSAKDWFGSVQVLDDGIVVAGHTGGAISADVATLRYHHDGTLDWSRTYDGADGWDGAAGMALDGAGNIYVAGAITAADSTLDGLTLKYSPAGQLLWDRRMSGPEKGRDQLTAIAVDASGKIHATGSTMTSSGFRDAVTLTYDAAGQLLSRATYDGPAGGDDDGIGLDLGGGSVYVSGVSADTDSLEDFVTIKYDSVASIVAVDPAPPSLPRELRLSRVEPNPASERCQVSLELPRESSVTLELFDIQGRRARRFLAGKPYAPGRHQIAIAVAGLREGIYFLRLVTLGGHRSQTRIRRLVVIE